MNLCGILLIADGLGAVTDFLVVQGDVHRYCPVVAVCVGMRKNCIGFEIYRFLEQSDFAEFTSVIVDAGFLRDGAFI